MRILVFLHIEKLYGRFLIKLGLLKSVAKEAVSKYDIQGVNSISQNAPCYRVGMLKN